MASSRSSSRAGSSALALLLAVLAGAGALPARADCPTNFLKYDAFSTAQSDAPAFDVPLGDDFGVPTDLGYDLTPGRLHEHSFAGIGSSSWVRVEDFYDVAGVAPGTMVVATAELAVSNAWVGTENGCGGTGCWGFVHARIVTAADSTEQSAGINVYDVGKQTAGGAHATDADATIRYLGLPPGAYVVSCQGYVDPSTPARSTSWGRVKGAYR